MCVEGNFCIADDVDVFKLLVEHLVHLNDVNRVLIALKHCFCQSNRLLEARLGDLLILLHERADDLEVSISKSNHDFILVVVNAFLEESLGLSDQPFKLFGHSEV